MFPPFGTRIWGPKESHVFRRVTFNPNSEIKVTGDHHAEVGNGKSLFYKNLYFSALPRLRVNFGCRVQSITQVVCG